MAFTFFLASAAERDALIKRDIFTEFSSFANDNSCAVVDKKSVADSRAGMNLNPR